MRGFSRLFVSIVPAILVYAAGLVACTPEERDCHDFIASPPTFELMDRVGDEGIPYYLVDHLAFGSNNPYANLPTCDGADGLRPGVLLSLSNVTHAEDIGRCDLQHADLMLNASSITFALSDEWNAGADRVQDLRLATQAVLAGDSAATFDGCRGEWVVSIDASYDSNSGPTSDPGEGVRPPWVVTRYFEPLSACSSIPEPCIDIFSARIVTP